MNTTSVFLHKKRYSYQTAVSPLGTASLTPTRLETERLIKCKIFILTDTTGYAEGKLMSGIMVIEDDESMLELIDLILTTEGFECHPYIDPTKALSELENVKPDLIILDLMMPVMSGWDVKKRLNENESTASIPVIVLTARSDTLDKIKGLKEYGVESYLVKPVGKNELVSTIRKVLADVS